MDTTASPTHDDAGEDAIALWNPMAAALWSLLLTPAFGAWLHARNWERLGHPEKAKEAQAWVVAICIVSLVNLVVVAVATANGSDFSIPSSVSLVLLGVWYGMSAHAQVKYVALHHGQAYVRRTWGLALVTGLAAVAAFLLLNILVLAAVSP